MTRPDISYNMSETLNLLIHLLCNGIIKCHHPQAEGELILDLEVQLSCAQNLKNNS